MKNMNKDLCMIIASYIITHKYKLLDYINNDKLSKNRLGFNKNAINYHQKS